MCNPSRDRLLAAGQTLFSAQGYAATSMRQVAESAGLALGGIYNHFPSKEALFQTILLEHNPFLRCNLRHLPETPDRQQFKILLEELTQEPEFFTLILIELLEFKGSHLPQFIEKIFGENPPSAASRTLLSLLIAQHLTQILLASALPSGAQPQISPDVLLETFLAGTLKPE